MTNIKEILIKNNFNFAKKFGQNFITDKNFLASIVDGASVESNDEVLEIGAGAGTLTRAISEKAKKVVSYEIDNNLKPVLEESLIDCKNANVVFGDALNTDIKEIESHFENDYKIVANLPYYITTPLMFKFLEETDRVKSITVMVQKEVAERMVAKPNSKEYGALTLAIDFFGNAKIIKKVSRNMFYPVPNVDSAVIRIDIVKNKFDIEKELFLKVVKASFSMRRKTLVNNLSQSFGIDKELIKNILLKFKMNENIRGESLSTNDFVNLSKELSRHI